MMHIAALVALLLASSDSAYGQPPAAGAQGSDSGSQFVLVYLQNIVDLPQNRPVELHVANGGSAVAHVNITLPLHTSSDCQSLYAVSVPPASSARVILCSSIRHSYLDGSVAGKAVFVQSDQEVSVVGYNSDMFSADAFSVLPTNALRTIYTTTTYAPTNIATQFGIVAAQDTTVGIYVKPSTGSSNFFEYRGQLYKNGDFVRFSLPRFNTFLAYSLSDLSGLVIWSDKPVAVFSGDARTYVDYTRGSRDHIVEQAIPASQFGSQFVFTPTPRNNAGDVVRIVARLFATKITTISGNSHTVVTLNGAGDVLEASYSDVTHFIADKPVSISVIVRSQEGPTAASTDPNDPSIYFLPAIDLYSSRNRVTPTFVYSVGDTFFAKSYLLISVPNGQQGGLRIDGVAPVTTGPWSRPTDPLALDFVTAAAIIDPASAHVVDHINPSVKFSVVIYSASDRESAATVLGLSYWNQCVETAQVPGDGVDNDCDGSVDEEFCTNTVDDDHDLLVNEDCKPLNITVQFGDTYEVVFLSNDIFDGDSTYISQVELYVASIDNHTIQVDITSPKYFLDNGSMAVNISRVISPGAIPEPITIPDALRLAAEADFGTSTKSSKGIQVKSPNGAFFLYGINKRTYSTDSFLAYPVSAADSKQAEKVYYTVSSDVYGNDYDRNIIGIVAYDNDTDVYVDIRGGVKIFTDSATYDGPTTIPLLRLKSHDSWELQSLEDLTGTRVRTNKRISVFSGNIRNRIPSDQKSRDHLVEQMPMVDLLGSSYSSLATPRRTNVGDQWKVVATQPNTNVRYAYRFLPNGLTVQNVIQLANPGDFHLIDPQASVSIHIEADDQKPILVCQLVKSQNGDQSDPALIYLPPRQQWTTSYPFLTPLSGKITGGVQLPYSNSLVIVVDRAAKDTVTLQSGNAPSQVIGNTLSWVDVPGTAQVAASVSVSHGQHLVTNAQPFMLIMFGTQDRESYGSVAGLLFKRTPPSCVSTHMVVGDGVDNDCDERKDEELLDGLDNDGDGAIDEDCYTTPSLPVRYYALYEDNLVEYPKLYSLELYIGASAKADAVCSIRNPSEAHPRYDLIASIPKSSVKSFAFSPALRIRGVGVSYNSFRIDCSGEVTIFGLNKDTYSADGFSVFPASSLGTEYYVVSYRPEALQGQYAIVATEPGTTKVSVTEAGSSSPLSVTLAENEVYQGQGHSLSGTHISADKKVAVFSGDIRTSVKLSKSRDHLVAQIPSVDKWGTSFNLVPTAHRAVDDIYQIISNGVANVELCCLSTTDSFVVNRGDVKEFSLKDYCHLRSSTPIIVARISQSHLNGELTGDPSMVIVVPESQYGTGATATTPVSTRGFTSLSADYSHYLTIIVRAGTQQDVLIDGLTIATTPATTWVQIPCSNYVAATIPVSGGHSAFTLSHAVSSVRLTAVLDGNADRESYSVTLSQVL